MRTAVRNKLAFLGAMAAWVGVSTGPSPSPAWGQSAWPRTPAANPGNGEVRPIQQPAPAGALGPASGSEPGVLGSAVPPAGPRSRSILNGEVNSIDLGTALRLAGVQNPEVLIARQRVLEAVAMRQLAVAQLIPSLNAGSSFNTHSGVLQQSNGNMLSVNRSSVYVGAGSFAVAAGTVAIPGLILTGNVAEALFRLMISKQVVRQAEFTSLAERNQAFLRVCLAYCDLLQAEGRRAIAEGIRADAEQVAAITAEYARSGAGRPADADRAATELSRRRADVRQHEGEILAASARLCRVLNLDPSIRLHPTDAWVVPSPIVPDPIPIAELIALALVQRPEMGARRAVVREALLALHGARVLPFSPTVFLGFSSGGYGGGSNLVRPVFGGFGGRSDFDAVAYWTLLNMGVGNAALIKVARAHVGVTQFQQLAMLDHIRDEVAEAYARTHARYQQILEDEEAVRSGIRGFREDLERIKQAAGLPIEVLNNLHLKADAEYGYLAAIVEYNKAHFELYVALGQPPAASLARPVPTEGFPDPTASPFQPAPMAPGPAAGVSSRGMPTAPAAEGAPTRPSVPTPPASGRSPFATPVPAPNVPGRP
ncbi:MAG: TolC family protein [Isosphaeraceae bacterium]